MGIQAGALRLLISSLKHRTLPHPSCSAQDLLPAFVYLKGQKDVRGPVLALLHPRKPTRWAAEQLKSARGGFEEFHVGSTISVSGRINAEKAF